jgi:hypothetical protein
VDGDGFGVSVRGTVVGGISPRPTGSAVEFSSRRFQRGGCTWSRPEPSDLEEFGEILRKTCWSISDTRGAVLACLRQIARKCLEFLKILLRCERRSNFFVEFEEKNNKNMRTVCQLFVYVTTLEWRNDDTIDFLLIVRH